MREQIHAYGNETCVKACSTQGFIEWETEVKRRLTSSYTTDKQFKAMQVLPALIKTTVSVEIS
jgi:hypothetical protein